MGLLDMIRPKGWLCGHVTIERIPANFGILVNLLVHRARGIADGAPSNAHLYEVICIKEREQPEVWPIHFAIARPKGLYHVGLSAIVLQDRAKQLYAQVERFFPIRDVEKGIRTFLLELGRPAAVGWRACPEPPASRPPA